MWQVKCKLAIRISVQFISEGDGRQGWIKFQQENVTADVHQPWTNPHDCYFEYLIIRFDYLIIPFDYLIIGWKKANL